VLLLTRPDSSDVTDNNLVADNLPSTEITVPADSVTVQSDIALPDDSPVVSRNVSSPVAVIQKTTDEVLVADNHTEDASSVKEEEVFDVIRDTTSITDMLLADASTATDKAEETEEYVKPTGTFGFEDFPEEPQRRVRRPMSIGLSGAVSDSPVLKSYDGGYSDLEAEPKPPYEGGSDLPVESPGDSLHTDMHPSNVMMKRTQRAYSDRYDHQIPVSAGISARFYLTDRLSINTGLNYTRYKSLRTRTYTSTYDRQKDWQYVHYLGVPVRLDWMAVNRKHFNLYVGAGMQMDKCVYATVGEERLHEKQILFGLNGAVGLQVNVIPMVGIYFEPDVSYALNEGSIETFRSDEPFTIAVRAGLRFNF
jgi:hypothetical protein